jgi:hypothetical protein
MIKLAHRSEQLPRSLFKEDIIVLPNATLKLGGFGDVYAGSLDGRAIAVKNPRVVGADPFFHKVMSFYYHP